jgi:hypothetical protein
MANSTTGGKESRGGGLPTILEAMEEAEADGVGLSYNAPEALRQDTGSYTPGDEGARPSSPVDADLRWSWFRETACRVEVNHAVTCPCGTELWAYYTPPGSFERLCAGCFDQRHRSRLEDSVND